MLSVLIGISFALSVVAIILYLKKQEQQPSMETGVTYVYDDVGRLQSILPTTQPTQFIRMKQAG